MPVEAGPRAAGCCDDRAPGRSYLHAGRSMQAALITACCPCEAERRPPRSSWFDRPPVVQREPAPADAVENPDARHDHDQPGDRDADDRDGENDGHEDPEDSEPEGAELPAEVG